jgi:predicted nucleotidyltransferase
LNSDEALSNITRAEAFSEDKIQLLRTELSKNFSDEKVCIVTTGSFARRDASAMSDLDYILVNHNTLPDNECLEAHRVIAALLSDLGITPPSAGGSFAASVTIPELTTNIGGKKDTNDALTWRMLILLECDYLLGPDSLITCRSQMIERYVNDHIKDKNIIRFFLNDLIRYHKTIGVDFEFKTSEDGKSWGTRNIKLQFSRKLLYFSGVLIAAESANKSPEEKRELAEQMFLMTPRQRIKHVCGESADPVFLLYDKFLGRMCDPEFREIANRAGIDRSTHDAKFKEAKVEGHEFSRALYSLLHQTYSEDNPIHQALIL